MPTSKKRLQIKALPKKQSIKSISHKIGSKLSLKNIKKHPYISLGTAAVALSAVSGLTSWVRGKRNETKHFFSFRKK